MRYSGMPPRCSGGRVRLQELAQRTIDTGPTTPGRVRAHRHSGAPAAALDERHHRIAVGMGTNISRRTTISGSCADALTRSLEAQGTWTSRTCSSNQGPGVSHGGQILNSKSSCRPKSTRTGQGSTPRPRRMEARRPASRRKQVVVTSIPYAVNKSHLVMKSATWSGSGSLTPAGGRARREHQGRGASASRFKRARRSERVMAYLYKHTPLQTNFGVNLTLPGADRQPEVGAPNCVSI